MTRIHILGGVAALLLVILIVVLGLRGGSGPSERLKPPKAVAFLCTACDYKFGVEQRPELWPPLVCPECSGDAVMVSVMQPRSGGGDPVIVSQTRFGQQQITAMKQHARDVMQDPNGSERLADEPPDAWLASQDDGPMIKYPLFSDNWISPQMMLNPPATLETYLGSVRSDYFPVPVFPEDWPIRNEAKAKYQ